MRKANPVTRCPASCRPVVAALALLAGATGACAQSSVTVYGIADAYLRVEHGAEGTMKTLGTGLSRGSRLGFRINEDLGGGFKALGILEMGIGLDDGTIQTSGNTAPGWGRQAFVAVGSERTGLLALGRQYTPIFAFSAGALDPFGANYLGTINASQGNQGGLTSRANNSINYSYNYAAAMDSPTPRNGFSFAAVVAPGEAANGSRAGDQYGMAVAYGQGRWFLGYANHSTRGSASSTPPSTSPKQTSHVAGGTLNLDWAMFFAALHRTKNDAAGTAAIERQNWSLGTRIPMPSGQIIAQVQRSDDRTAANRDISNFSVAYEYPFSRRTLVYANYGRIINNANASATLYLTSVTVTPGLDPSALALGIRHNF